MPSRSSEKPTDTTDGRMRTRRQTGPVPNSVQADSPGESSGAMPCAWLLSTEPRAAEPDTEWGACSHCRRGCQCSRVSLAGGLWKEWKRSIAHAKGRHCFRKLVSGIHSVCAVSHCEMISRLWILSRSGGVPLFLLNKL